MKDKTTEVGDNKTEVSTHHVKSEDKTVVAESVGPAEAVKLRQSEDKTVEAEDSDSVAEEDTNSSSESVSEDIDIVDVVGVPVVNMSGKAFEPPAFVSESKNYATYKDDLLRWSRITNVVKKNQAEVVVYGLEGHPSGIKEKITVNIGDKIQDADDGIDELIKYLDTIYKEDEMAEAWFKYKSFQKVVRAENVVVNQFIAEFEKQYLLAKTAGCDYSDTLLAFRLLEATRLGEMDEKFVLTGVDFSSAKTNKDLFKQMKSSLKKFQGRSLVSSGDEKMRHDPTLIAEEVKQVLLAQGWKQPPRARKRSNTDPGQRKGGYKGKKNPLGTDGKPLKCFKCGSEYHFRDKCKDRNSNESGLISICNEVKDDGEIHAENDNLEFELVMIADMIDQICLLVEDAGMRAIIDSACSKTVAGKVFIEKYVQHLPSSMKEQVEIGTPSKTIYQFGGGEQRRSLRKVKLPAWIGDLKLSIETEVVEASIPLLIGANSLEKSKAVIDFCAMKVKFFSTEVELMKVRTGHFCISLLPKEEPVHPDIDEIVLHAVTSSNQLSYKDLQKLHHVCGHTADQKIIKLIEKAGRLDENTKPFLEKIHNDCKSCQTNGRLPPRPKFSMPRVDSFNQIVTIDLKEYSRTDVKRRYICYLIDMFSRLVAAKFIHDKQPERIVETILEKWIGVGYGVMRCIHSDIGGEMSNKEMQDVASILDVRLTTTASYSPHQNGVNERNHATVDFMMKKMMDSDSSLTPENALFWSLNAKNSLQNCYGFSPYQLVFAANPQLPSATLCGPPGYENVSISDAFVKNSNALHQAREAFIEAESSITLKKALKSRIHLRGDNIEEGDYIYYKKDSKGGKIFRGPSKVVAVNGKKLFIDEGARMSTVNRDVAVRQGDEFWTIDQLNEENDDMDTVQSVVDQDKELDAVDNDDNNHIENEAPQEEHTEVNVENEIPHGNVEVIEDLNNADRLFTYKDIKKGYLLKFKPNETNEIMKGRMISRAGKLGGKYESWWNIEDVETGNKSSFDTSKFTSIEKLESATEVEEEQQREQVFVVQIPRYLHDDQKCIKAKEKELKSWDEFGVIEEVTDEGQETLGTSWMLTEKVIDGVLDVKARLCVRGDQEKSSFRTDSPTVHKSSINIFFMLAAYKKWQIQTGDIKCAFLQGENIDRDVYLKPPKERRISGMIWKMKKPAYGLRDASRKFYLQLCGVLKELGCRQSKFDPAVYLFFDDEGNLEGIVLTHVDDLMHGSGGIIFYNCVMIPLKQKFLFGSEEAKEFRYVGMHVKQFGNFVSVNQDHYLSSIEIPDIRYDKEDQLLDEEGQSEFRSILGRIGWLGNHSRPDLAFDHMALSTKLGNATGQDLCSALKVVKKMLASTTEIRFPYLGDCAHWSMEVYADAGFKSLPDKVSSCGGQVVFMRNSQTSASCVLSWKARKLRRIVTSSTAAETLASNEAVSEVIFLKALLGEIFGSCITEIPVNLYTDSKNVLKTVHSTSMADDPRLRTEIACLKESIEKKEVTSLILLPSEKMLANCMTKKGASAKTFLEVLRNGKLLDPLQQEH